MKKRVIIGLLFSVALLLSLGLIVLSSASTSQSLRLYDNPNTLFVKQLWWIAAGIVLALAAQSFDYRKFKSVTLKGKLREIPVLTVALYLAIILALAFVFVPGVGIKINGSRCWLDLGFYRIQPSEFVKVATVIVLSVWLDHLGPKCRTFKDGFVFSLLLMAPIAVLILLEVDVGAFVFICALWSVMLVIAGARLRYLLPILLLGISSLWFWLLSCSVRRYSKILAWQEFIFGNDLVTEKSYQLSQSLKAIQSGGLWGVGYNHSLLKYRYLPECHTDFVFAIGAEEFGVFFSLAVVALFVMVIVCGVMISLHARDKLGCYMAFGLTFLIAFQCIFNLAVVTGLAPTIGIALPFFSFGGSSLCAMMIAVGLLINIAKKI